MFADIPREVCRRTFIAWFWLCVAALPLVSQVPPSQDTGVQGEAKVLKKYLQMKLQMKREALVKLNRKASEAHVSFGTGTVN